LAPKPGLPSFGSPSSATEFIELTAATIERKNLHGFLLPLRNNSKTKRFQLHLEGPHNELFYLVQPLPARQILAFKTTLVSRIL